MIGILAKILGSGDVVKQGIDLIDSMHTSTEEEVAVKSKAKTDLLQAYAPFKIAQRMLAFMFGFTQLRQGFFPTTSTPLFFVDLFQAQGTDIRASDELADRVRARLSTLEGVTEISSWAGRGPIRGRHRRLRRRRARPRPRVRCCPRRRGFTADDSLWEGPGEKAEFPAPVGRIDIGQSDIGRTAVVRGKDHQGIIIDA